MLGWPFADVQSGADSAANAADIRKGTAPPSCFCSQAETCVLFTVGFQPRAARSLLTHVPRWALPTVFIA